MKTSLNERDACGIGLETINPFIMRRRLLARLLS
jgi:hypothetical protein